MELNPFARPTPTAPPPSPLTGPAGAPSPEEPKVAKTLSPEAAAKVVAEVNEKFTQWRDARRPYEIQWFTNAAMLRGNHYVNWNESKGMLEAKPAPPHRVRLAINRILPKIRARIAKFTKNRPTPLVVAASTDREDRINARATQKVLEYVQRKLQVELRYKEAVLWSAQCGKGFWWLRWDAETLGRVQSTDPFTGEQTITDVKLGDVSLESGSPFEVFVADMGIMRLADQPEIMRVKMRPIDGLKARFPQHAAAIKAEVAPGEIFQYERQIANLGARNSAYGAVNEQEKVLTHCAVKEHFIAPCATYPKGAYRVVIGDVLVKHLDQLPLGFHTMANPYPVVEFPDIETAGQFWPTTHIEQMVGLQQEYNHFRSRMAEHLRMMIFPKIIVPEQFRMGKEAWTSEAGQIVRYLAIAGLPGPQVWNPPNLSSDAWKMLDSLKQEFDDVTNIFPAMQGAVGTATSGFQTNLLQEAADSVHGPDIRLHELAMEDAAMKMRRIMKQGYDIPRLVAVVGKNYQPDVFEFSADQIDEHADIVIQTGSALSNSPATRSQQVFELYNSGLLGDPTTPEARRAALGLLSLNTQEEMQELSHRDDEQARLETLEAERGIPIESPKPWENHDVHWAVHTDQLKAPGTRDWPQERVRALVLHTVLHGRFINPQNAQSIAQEFGLTEILHLFTPPPAPPGPPAGPGPDAGQNPVQMPPGGPEMGGALPPIGPESLIPDGMDPAMLPPPPPPGEGFALPPPPLM